MLPSFHPQALLLCFENYKGLLYKLLKLTSFKYGVKDLSWSHDSTSHNSTGLPDSLIFQSYMDTKVPYLFLVPLNSVD